MPNFSKSFVENTIVNATPTTTVEPVKSLPFNCHTIIIYNSDTTNALYFAIGEADPANPIAVADRGLIPAGESLTIAMGILSLRPNPTNKIVFSSQTAVVRGYITFVCGNRI